MLEPSIDDPDTLLSLADLDAIYGNVYRLSREPDCGLQLGRALNISRWGVLTLAMVTSDSLQHALRTGNRFRRLVHSHFNLYPEYTSNAAHNRVEKSGEVSKSGE